jgi:hypothetical protein
LTISKIVFWNSGKDELRDSDFPAGDPFRVCVGDALEILESSIIQSTSDACACKLHARDKRSFSIGFDFLDPRDGAVLQIAHTGTSSEDVALKGRIVGAGKIIRRQPGGPLRYVALTAVMPKTRRASRLFVTWVMAIAALLLIASAWLPRVEFNTRWNKVIPVSIGILYLIIAVSMYRSRRPRGLDRYEDEFGDSEPASEIFHFPEARAFTSRNDAARWVIAQAQAYAHKTNARFEATVVSDNNIDLDLDYYWLTMSQLNELIAFGRKHGFDLVIHGKGTNPFVPQSFHTPHD